MALLEVVQTVLPPHKLLTTPASAESLKAAFGIIKTATLLFHPKQDVHPPV